MKEKYVTKTVICNAVSWSVNGKYAIGALCGKLKSAPIKRVSHLVVWDSLEEIYWIIPKDNSFELSGNLCGLAVHPSIESIIVCGGGNGFLYVINIETCQIVQSFRETGIWSHSSELPADILECVFAPNGLEFAVSTSLGTISFYGSLSKDGFDSCPVEQFFKSDYINSSDEEKEQEHVNNNNLCNSRLVEYAFKCHVLGRQIQIMRSEWKS